MSQGEVRTGAGDDQITLEVDDTTTEIFVFCGDGNDTVMLDLSATNNTDVDIYVDCNKRAPPVAMRSTVAAGTTS